MSTMMKGSALSIKGPIEIIALESRDMEGRILAKQSTTFEFAKEWFTITYYQSN